MHKPSLRGAGFCGQTGRSTARLQSLPARGIQAAKQSRKSSADASGARARIRNQKRKFRGSHMRTSFGPNFKHSLLLGTSIAAIAWGVVPAMAQNASGNETVIVTGTRVQGMTAADSAAPITVLGSDALTTGTGSTDLRQALGQIGSLLHGTAVRRRHRQPDALRRAARPLAQRHPGPGERQAPSLYRQPACRWRRLRGAAAPRPTFP